MIRRIQLWLHHAFVCGGRYMIHDFAAYRDALWHCDSCPYTRPWKELA